MDLDDLDDAGDLLGVRGIIGGDFPSHDRGPGDDRVFLARQPDVLPVYGPPGRNVEAVDDVGPFLADVAELRRIFETQAVGRRDVHLAGVGGELSIAELFPGGLLNDLVILRFYVGDWNAPTLGRGLLQHHSRRGSGLAHRLHEMAGRARPVRILIAELYLVAGRLGDLHSGPVGFQLISDDQRHAGTHALTHFRSMTYNGYGAIGSDGHESQRIVHSAMRHDIGAPFRGVGGRQA